LSRSGGLEEEAGEGRRHRDARRAEEEWPARPRCWCSRCCYRRCGFWCCSCRRCGRWCFGDVSTTMSHTLLLPLRHQTGFRTMFWPASALPSAERRFRPHYNSSFYVFLSCLPLSQRDCALRMRSIYMLIRLSRGVLRAEIQLRTIPRSFVIYKRRNGVHVFFCAYVRFLCITLTIIST